MDKEKFKKKWENFWYYYKWHTVVAIFVAIVVAVGVTQCARRVNPDFTVMFITKDAYLTDDQKAGLQQVLQKYATDLNGDGQKVVSIENMKINEDTDASTAMAYRQKLMAEVAGTDNTIFITDDEFYKYLTSQGEFFCDLNSINKKVDEKTTKVKLSSIGDLNFGTFKKAYGDLYISARRFNNQSPANSTKKEVKGAVETLNKLLESYTKQ